MELDFKYHPSTRGRKKKFSVGIFEIHTAVFVLPSGIWRRLVW